MIQLRRARPADAPGIATVHVSAWRNAYAGLLPDEFLSGLSDVRRAVQYDEEIRAGRGVFVALGNGGVIGFSTVGHPRAARLADGEIETLYVLDDWRDRGVGRRLLRAGALHLAQGGCRSAFLWVLRDNPSRWFYERMGGRAAMEGTTRVAGVAVPQTAYVWKPIELLLSAPPPS